MATSSVILNCTSLTDPGLATTPHPPATLPQGAQGEALVTEHRPVSLELGSLHGSCQDVRSVGLRPPLAGFSFGRRFLEPTQGASQAPDPRHPSAPCHTENSPTHDMT